MQNIVLQGNMTSRMSMRFHVSNIFLMSIKSDGKLSTRNHKTRNMIIFEKIATPRVSLPCGKYNLFRIERIILNLVLFQIYFQYEILRNE